MYDILLCDGFTFCKLCGPVKSWKCTQVPTDATPRGFGFCEFESAEGVLRALRLLSKFNIDGQDLVVCPDSLFIYFVFHYVFLSLSLCCNRNLHSLSFVIIFFILHAQFCKCFFFFLYLML